MVGVRDRSGSGSSMSICEVNSRVLAEAGRAGLLSFLRLWLRKE